MRNRVQIVLAGAFFLLCSPLALAGNEVEGRIEYIDQEEQSIVVQGIQLLTTDATDYEDGLKSFADLELGQKVEVDFTYRDGKHFATEIELED